jgi:hypothetical protein
MKGEQIGASGAFGARRSRVPGMGSGQRRSPTVSALQRLRACAHHATWRVREPETASKSGGCSVVLVRFVLSSLSSLIMWSRLGPSARTQ